MKLKRLNELIHWVKEETKLNDWCEVCACKFSLYTRPRTCRMCNNLVCRAHSECRIPIGDLQEPQRVCDDCAEIYFLNLVDSANETAKKKHSVASSNTTDCSASFDGEAAHSVNKGVTPHLTPTFASKAKILSKYTKGNNIPVRSISSYTAESSQESIACPQEPDAHCPDVSLVDHCPFIQESSTTPYKTKNKIDISEMNVSELRLDLGLALMNEKDYDSAIHQFKLSHASGDANAALYNIALCFYSNHSYKEAEYYCNKALEVFPEHAEAWTLLGNVNLKSGCFEIAKHCFQSSLSIISDKEKELLGQVQDNDLSFS